MTTVVSRPMPSFDEIAKRQAAKTMVKLTKPRSESGKRSLEDGESDSPKRVKVTPVPTPAPTPEGSSQISFKTPSEALATFKTPSEVKTPPEPVVTPGTPVPFQVSQERITEIEKQLEENRRVQAAAIATKMPPSPTLSRPPTILEMKRMSVDQIKQLDGKNLFRFVRFNRQMSLKLMGAKEHIFKVGHSGKARVIFRPSDLVGVSEEDREVFFQEFAGTIREWGFKTVLKEQTLDVYW